MSGCPKLGAMGESMAVFVLVQYIPRQIDTVVREEMDEWRKEARSELLNPLSSTLCCHPQLLREVVLPGRLPQDLLGTPMETVHEVLGEDSLDLEPCVPVVAVEVSCWCLLWRCWRCPLRVMHVVWALVQPLTMVTTDEVSTPRLILGLSSATPSCTSIWSP